MKNATNSQGCAGCDRVGDERGKCTDERCMMLFDIGRTMKAEPQSAPTLESADAEFRSKEWCWPWSHDWSKWKDIGAGKYYDDDPD